MTGHVAAHASGAIAREGAIEADLAPGRPVYEAIGRLLADLGARYCFGVAGTANFKISHALVEAGVTYVAARHECNAVMMAEAYAKNTGALTLASVHAGPGLTNAITGLAEAAKSRTPLVVLAGDVPGTDVTSTFYINQAELAHSVGAAFYRIHSAASALADTLRAVTHALHQRQAVLLSLPMDIQYSLVPADAPVPSLTARPTKAFPSPQAVSTLADLVDKAERPLILAGRGAVLANARDVLVALGERTGALLATSLQANGLFADQPWSLGLCGGFASEPAAELIRQSDLVLGFGVSFTYWTTRHGALFGRDTTVVQIDVEAPRLGFQRQVDHAVVGDAAATAEQLLRELMGRAPHARKPWRTESLRQEVIAADHHAIAYNDVSTESYLDPRTLSKAVDCILPKDRTLSLDAGHFMSWPPRYIRVPDADASCMGVSFQSIGLGIASAIGMGLAQPGRLAVLGIGDGGYMMSLADLETAVRLGLDMCIVIYDDASYAAEVHPFSAQGFGVEFVQFPDLDLAGIARSVGAKGIVARTLDDLAPLQAWVEEGAKGVFVVDAKISPHLEADWHIHATRGPGH